MPHAMQRPLEEPLNAPFRRGFRVAPARSILRCSMNRVTLTPISVGAGRENFMAIAQIKSVAKPKDLYGIGEIPPLGHVPDKMHAWVIRQDRHGPPDTSFKLEVVPTWPIGEDEVLLLVMAGPDAVIVDAGRHHEKE